MQPGKGLFGLYAVYDRVGEDYSPPQMYRTNAVAVRAVRQALEAIPHKDDYRLYHIADYDPTTGRIFDFEDHLVEVLLNSDFAAEDE